MSWLGWWAVALVVVSIAAYLVAVGDVALSAAGGQSHRPATITTASGDDSRPDGIADSVAIRWAAENGVSAESPENSEIRELSAAATFSIVDPEDPSCGRVVYDWSIERLDEHGQAYRIESTGQCAAVASQLTKNGLYLVTVRGVRAGGAVVAGEQEFRLRQFVIVSLGDSVASGEGNPRKHPPEWTDSRGCHRSFVAGPRQAAERFQNANRHVVVAFVHLACTGAWINGGENPPKFLKNHPSLLPVHPPDRGLGRPELAQLDILLGRGRPIDALLLSIGANDIGFSQILKFCLAPSLKQCYERKFHRMPLGTFVSERLRVLASSFEALAQRYPFAQHPDRVFLTQYFDPLRKGPSTFCPIPPKLRLISPDESEWAEKNVVQPLNTLLRRVAQDHKWNYVDGISDSFIDHGYCADKTWIVPIRLRDVRHWRGFFHPNRDGQEEYGKKINEKMAAIFHRGTAGRG